MRGEDGEDNYEGAEDDKVLSKVAVWGLMQMLMQDDDGGDAEEAVSVEWAEKCLTKHSFQVSLWQKKKATRFFSLETNVTKSWFSMGV